MDIFSPLKKAVSRSKRRYVDEEHGFNLDLSCNTFLSYFYSSHRLLSTDIIPERVVAMGFPSESLEVSEFYPFMLQNLGFM
jgi:hypothetical protein